MINSTKVLMRVNDGAAWHYIAGELSSSSKESFTPIDISSKSTQDYKVYLESGKRGREINLKLILNDSLGYDFLRSAYLAKSINQFEIVESGVEDVDIINAMIISWKESSGFNDALLVDVNLTQSL